MAQHIYEVGMDGQSVSFQSLSMLENTSSLATLVTTTSSDPSVCSESFAFEDEGDIFQCGRCKRQFGSLVVFVHHKREGCFLALHHNFYKYEKCRNELEVEEPSNRHAELSFRTYEDDQQCPPSEESHRNDQGVNSDGLNSSAPSLTSPVIHFTPSIVLGENALSFTIPVDQCNGGLAHLVTGTNQQSVLSIPESELAALINSGEHFQISSIEHSENSMGSHSIVLTASIIPQTSRESEDESLCSRLSVATPDVLQEIDQDKTTEINSIPVLDTPLPGNEREAQTVCIIANNLPNSNVKRKMESKPSTSPKMNGSSTVKKIKSVSSSEATTVSKTGNLAKPVVDESVPGTKSGPAPLDITKRKCEFCGKPFRKLFNLLQHVRSHTGEKPFHCLVCGRGFTQKSNVKKHMQTHKVWPKIKYTLPKEQLSVKLKSSSEVLFQEEENDSKTEDVEYVVNNVYVCQYCDQHYDNYHKLKTHLSYTHKNEKLFKCIHKDCVATFLEVEGLISHMKSHEDQIEYQCQNCPKKFKNLYDLGAHQYSHRLYPNKVSTNQQKKFRCTKCNSKYASAEALNHHLITSSHNYPCSHCKLTFVCERYLRRHLRIHGTVEPFKCELCGKMFKTENYLKSHMVIHSDSKPFHCEICALSFNRRDKLTRHQLIHDSRKKYKCPFRNTGCEREFYRKDKLKDHMMSHSRKNYACSKCGKNFHWPTRLRQHQSAHHPEMLFTTTCPTCQKIFKTKHHLKLHMCKGSNSSVTSQNYDQLNPSTPTENEESEFNATSVIVGVKALKKRMVLYNECESASDSHDKPDAMLGGYCQHSDDPENIILATYTESKKKDSVTNSECIIGPLEITYESGVGDPMEVLD